MSAHEFERQDKNQKAKQFASPFLCAEARQSDYEIWVANGIGVLVIARGSVACRSEVEVFYSVAFRSGRAINKLRKGICDVSVRITQT